MLKWHNYVDWKTQMLEVEDYKLWNLQGLRIDHRLIMVIELKLCFCVKKLYLYFIHEVFIFFTRDKLLFDIRNF